MGNGLAEPPTITLVQLQSSVSLILKEWGCFCCFLRICVHIKLVNLSSICYLLSLCVMCKDCSLVDCSAKIFISIKSLISVKYADLFLSTIDLFIVPQEFTYSWKNTAIENDYLFLLWVNCWQSYHLPCCYNLLECFFLDEHFSLRVAFLCWNMYIRYMILYYCLYIRWDENE